MFKYFNMIDHKEKIIFVHIPKNAGKSIEDMLWGYSAGNPHWKDMRIVNELTKGKYKRYWSFAVVRNPLDRLVSIYSYYAENQGNGSENDKVIGAVMRDLGFRGFIDTLFDGYGYFLDRLPSFRQDLYPHLKPQYQYVINSNGVKIVDYIGRYEKLSDLVDEISRHLGKEYYLPCLNKSKHGLWNDYYDPERFERALRIYAKDVELFYPNLNDCV